MFFKRKTYTETNFKQLIDDCISQQALAQKYLIEQYYGLAKKVCFKYTQRNEEIEEIINDSFMKTFKNLKPFESKMAFSNWFCRIIINTNIDYIRTKKPLVFLDDQADLFIEDINESILQKLSFDDILKLIHLLPQSYKIVFNLYVLEGYSHKEIADLLGIAEGTSKSNLKMARRKLQTLIITHYPEYQYKLKHQIIQE